jgi:hypothetical protein
MKVWKSLGGRRCIKINWFNNKLEEQKIFGCKQSLANIHIKLDKDSRAQQHMYPLVTKVSVENGKNVENQDFLIS